MPKLTNSSQPVHIKLNSYTNTNNSNDYIGVPFQEWSDNDINEENWDQITWKQKSFGTITEYEEYTDYQTIHLPPSLLMMEWKKPREVFPEREVVIYADNNCYPDLVNKNNHLLQSEFMRSYISSVETLWFLGNTAPFTWEFRGNGFAGDQNIPWRPWLHIYSKCKAGKGTNHSPIVNKSGKYIVRLFWLGSWRKVYIDDKLPLNEEGQVMFPILNVAKVPQDIKVPKKTLSEKRAKSVEQGVKNSLELNEIFEMWPYLLCKALLKIASLTWHGEEELIDFDIIQCLTGWIPYKYYTRGTNSDDVWNFCMKYTQQYEWPEENETDQHNRTKVYKETKKMPNQQILMACYHENVSQEKNYFRIGSEWGHHFLINQTRNKQLEKPTNALDYPAWKRYRWLDWAAKEGLIPPIESSMPIKSFDIVDPFSMIYRSNGSEPMQQEEYMMRQIHSLHGGTIDKKSDHSKIEGKYWKKRLSSNEHNFWYDYEHLAEKIKYLIVYFTPSTFHTRIRVSEIIPQPLLRSKSKSIDDITQSEWKEVFYSLKMKPQRNEPLYIFSDSLENEMLVLNLSQTGYTKELEPEMKVISELQVQSSVESAESECGVCLTTFLNRYKLQREKMNFVEIAVKPENVCYKPDHPRFLSHAVLGKYNWRINKQDEYITSFSTYGSSTILLNLKPGRHIFRLYIKSETKYCLLMISNNQVYASELYDLLYLMKEEPYLLSHFCSNISNNFEHLVDQFGKPDFIESLRNFYSDCKPDCELPRKDIKKLQEACFREILQVVRKLLGNEKAYHLQILFRHWQKPVRISSSTFDEGFCYNVDEIDRELVTIMDKAAQKIQSLFRGIYERSLLDYHNLRNKQHKKISDSLHVINTEIFSGKTNILPFIIRNFLKSPPMENIAPLYQFFDHIDNTVSFAETYESYSKIPMSGWICICRQKFEVEEPVLLKISFFCDLPQFFIKAFNNDTKEEMKYFTNNVALDVYVPNTFGYTLICYGFTNHACPYTYRLVLTGEKNPNESIIKMIPSQSQTTSLAGNYIPNWNNSICKCLFQTYSDLTVASIRLTTNFKGVKIHLKLSSTSGKVHGETVAFGDAFIPAVILEGEPHLMMDIETSGRSLPKKGKSPRRSRKPSLDLKKIASEVMNFYLIEATVLENSWPLTELEWKTVNKLKTDMLYRNRNVTEKFSKKQSMSSLESPFWFLQVITSSEDVTILERYKKRDMDIMDMKTEWFRIYPKRYQEAQELRRTFLNENKIPNPDKITSSTIRSLDPMIFEDKILPPFNFSQYARYDVTVERSCILNNQDDLDEKITRTGVKSVNPPQVDDNKMKETLKNVIDKQKRTYNMLNNWFQECRNESSKMMADAASMKVKYVQKMSRKSNA